MATSSLAKLEPEPDCTLWAESPGAGTACTEAAPCPLDYVKENANPADVICLMPGNYGELLFDSSSAVGTSENWIVYKGFSKIDTPNFTYITFDGTKKDAYTKFIRLKVDPGYVSIPREGGVVNLKGANYLWFESCDFQGEKIQGTGIAEGDTAFAPYVFGTSYVVAAGVNPGDASNITIKGCTFRYGSDQLFLKEDYRTPENRVENWTIINNDFSKAGNDNVNLAGSTSGHYIAGNYFHDQNQYISPFCWHGTPTGDWSGKEFESLVQDTTGATGKFYEMTYEIGSCAGRAGYIIYILSDDPATPPTRNNAYTWRLESDSNVYFTPSQTGDNAHIDMLTFQGTPKDIIVENNEFRDNGDGGQIIKFDPIYSIDGPENILFRNNLLYRVENADAYLLYITSAKNVHIYNNIIDAGSDPLQRAIRIDAFLPGSLVDLYLYNNIISGAIPSNGSFYSDYNIWFTEPPSEFNEGINSKVVVDYDSILFISRGDSDYRLNPASPAIDAADPNKAAPLLDITGFLRDENPDIGPYEYVK